MVRFRFRVISGYDVTLNMSTAVRIKLQIVMWKFSPTKKTHYNLFKVVVRVRLNLETLTLTLILNPQSFVFLGGLRL